MYSFYLLFESLFFFLTWNVADFMQVLENLYSREANTSQPVSTTMMNTGDEPLHTAVPSNDEVWEN